MKYVQKYILVPKEEWEKINPQVKHVKQLNIPKREKNTSHHQKVVTNFPVKDTQMKKTLMKTVMKKKQYQSNSENSTSGEEFAEEYTEREEEQEEESYENSETEGNNTDKED